MPTVKRFCIDAILFELACAECFQYDAFNALLSRPFFSEWIGDNFFEIGSNLQKKIAKSMIGIAKNAIFLDISIGVNFSKIVKKKLLKKR